MDHLQGIFSRSLLEFITCGAYWTFCCHFRSDVPAGCLGHALAALDSAAESVRRADLGETVRLRIAFVGALLDESFVRVIQEFRKAHPRCQVHLSDLPPRDQMERIQDGSVDIAFVGACPRQLPRKLLSLIWKKEPRLVALPEDHCLASFDIARLKQLGGDPWVMVSRQAALEFRLRFAELCQAQDFKPRIV